jgi:ribosomal protein L11 methyltransferase
MADAAEVRVAAEEVDLVSGLLWGAGVAAVAEEPQPDGTVVLRVDVPAGGIAALAAAVGGRWPVVAVAVDAGLDGWRPHARVVRAGPFVVRPPWVPLGPVAPGEVVVEIDPGASFGHGAHPTTRLCLALLGDLLGEPSGGESPANRRSDTCPGSESAANRRLTGGGPATMLDVGCGSGVLAIAAVLRGARSAVAIDVDPAAIDATRANAARNGVADRIETRLVGAAGETPETGFDVVVANIGAAALRTLAPELVARVATGGTLVLSGLLDPPPDDLVASFAPLDLLTTATDDGWSALVLGTATP